AGAAGRPRQPAERAVGISARRWRQAMAAAAVRHAAAAETRHRADLRGQARRCLPHLRRRLRADRRRTGELYRRAIDLHLPPNVHRLGLSRRRRRFGTSGPHHRGILAACGPPAQRPAVGLMTTGDPAWRRLADAGVYGFLAVVCFLILVPIYWIVATSFKPTSEILVTPTSIITMHPTLDHYRIALGGDF